MEPLKPLKMNNCLSFFLTFILNHEYLSCRIFYFLTLVDSSVFTINLWLDLEVWLDSGLPDSLYYVF